MKKAISFLSGAILGAMVGAAVAILLAPAPGDVLQQRIQGRIEAIQGEVRQASQERRRELEQQLANLRAPRQPGASK
jgi:gas vesicle protein